MYDILDLFFIRNYEYIYIEEEWWIATKSLKFLFNFCTYVEQLHIYGVGAANAAAQKVHGNNIPIVPTHAGKHPPNTAGPPAVAMTAAPPQQVVQQAVPATGPAKMFSGMWTINKKNNATIEKNFIFVFELWSEDRISK